MNESPTDPTDQGVDPFERELGAAMRSAAEQVAGAGITRADVDAAVGRRRGLGRRRLAVVAATVVVVAGAGALVLPDGSPSQVRTAGRDADATEPEVIEAPPATCEQIFDPVNPVLGTVALSAAQVEALQAASFADDAFAVAADAGPVEVTLAQVDALQREGRGLDGDQIEALVRTAPPELLTTLARRSPGPGGPDRTGGGLSEVQVMAIVLYERSLVAEGGLHDGLRLVAHLPGLVQLTSAQVDALIDAELVDPDTAYLARRGPVPLDVQGLAADALDAAGVALDGQQLFFLGYGPAGIEYLREDGAYVGYRCPDGSASWLYPPPAGLVVDPVPSTTTTVAPAAPSTTTTTDVGSVPSTSTAAPGLATTTIPAGDGQVLSADLVEGQQVWGVYVRALSIEGGDVDGHGRAGLAEDYLYESMAILDAAGYAPELTPLPCDGDAAVAAVLAVLPDGPPGASPASVSAMGAYFVDEAAARRAADRLGDEVLAIAPVTATCVDVDGPNGYRR